MLRSGWPKRASFFAPPRLYLLQSTTSIILLFSLLALQVVFVDRSLKTSDNNKKKLHPHLRKPWLFNPLFGPCRNDPLRGQTQAVSEHLHCPGLQTLSVTQVARCSSYSHFTREPCHQAFLVFPGAKLLLRQLVLVQEHPQEELVRATKLHKQAHSIQWRANCPLCDAY